MWEFAAFENLHFSLYNPVWSRRFYLLSEIVGPPGRKSGIVRNCLFSPLRRQLLQMMVHQKGSVSESEQKDELKVFPSHRRFKQMPVCLKVEGRATDDPLKTVWRSNWAE